MRKVADLVGLGGDHRDVSATNANSAGLPCAVTVGRLPDEVAVTVRAKTGAPGSGRLMYEGLCQVQQGSSPVTELAGIGTTACTYTDSTTGVTVMTYDANLYLTVTAAPLRPGADLPEGLVAGLGSAASSALTALRA